MRKLAYSLLVTSNFYFVEDCLTISASWVCEFAENLTSFDDLS